MAPTVTRTGGFSRSARRKAACAGFAGAVELSKMTDYLESSGLGAHWENAAHIVWATGGALVPEGECEKYLAN